MRPVWLYCSCWLRFMSACAIFDQCNFVADTFRKPHVDCTCAISLSLRERCFVPDRPPAAAANMMGIVALREENRILEIQNELIKLFLALPPSVADAETGDSRSDGDDRPAVAPHLRTPRARTKRKRPPRRPTTPTGPCYELDSQAAFEKYGFPVPETARDALLLMMCVPEQDMRDLRRAARMCIMWLLFPSHVDEQLAV